MTLLTIVYIKTIDFYIIPILFVTFQRFAVVVTYFNKITYLLRPNSRSITGRMGMQTIIHATKKPQDKKPPR